MSNCVRVSDTRGHLSALLQRKRVNWVTWSFDGHYLISNYVIQLRLTVIRDGEARQKRGRSLRAKARDIDYARYPGFLFVFGDGRTKVRKVAKLSQKRGRHFLHLRPRVSREFSKLSLLIAARTASQLLWNSFLLG